MESAEYLRGKRDAGNEIYREICAAAVQSEEVDGQPCTWSDAASIAAIYADHHNFAAQATPEEDLGTAPPKRSGTIKVTLTRGGSGKPLECGEGDEPEGRDGATWELAEACARHFERIKRLSKTSGEAYLRYAAENRANAALALIAEARKGGK